MEGGGAQSPLPAIIRSIEQAGAEVKLFALARKDGKAIARLEAAGIEPVIFEGGLNDHLAAWLWAKREIAAFRPGAVWTSLTRATLVGQAVGRSLGVPVVSWQHSAFLKPWNERLLRWRRKASDLWIADSEEVAALTRKRLQIEPEKVMTWPIFAADPEAPQADPWQEGEPVRLGAMGRLHVSKGYDVLIDALALLKSRKLPEFSIVIGGSGPEERALRDRAHAAGLSDLEFAGFIDDPQRFLAGLHLYLQPSRREGFCIAMHEAMQASLPVIVSRTGEMPYTVDDPELGRIVAPEDATALAEAIAELLENPAELASMGQAGRKRVLERYSKLQFETKAAEIVAALRRLSAP
ncbi:glycosyltransferase family 4 protein [Qipengyuania sp. GH29]|nr:glycosyltransferase family 4 protein [Qipengyuania sphaerica]MBX7540562.1 glycosyltransferase family 4 protein [Qipengyuania sphaerica]